MHSYVTFSARDPGSPGPCDLESHAQGFFLHPRRFLILFCLSVDFTTGAYILIY